MSTQKLIHSATPARTWNSASGPLAPRTTEQILDQVTTCALAEEKKDRYESRSTRLEPFRQTGIRRIAPPVPALHRWGVVLAGGDGVRLRKLTRWMYGERWIHGVYGPTRAQDHKVDGWIAVVAD